MRQASKAFFSEEKKQKTFVRLSRTSPQPPTGSRSFLLLFLEKEGLSFFEGCV